MRKKGNTNLLIIGDPHAHPDYDNTRFEALGKFIASARPHIVVCMGDLGDMPSLSSYDRGTRGFEGRRYQKDVDVVIDAQERLFHHVKKARGYSAKWHMVVGNHEDRISKATNASPELDGTIGIKDLQYRKFSWNVTPFKRALKVENIMFSHYFTSGIMGRPISSIHIGHALISKLHCSAVQGHSHLYNHSEQTKPDGQKIFGLSAGCFSHPDYTETWCADTEHQWWRGVIMLEGLDGEGYYNGIHAITQRSML